MQDHYSPDTHPERHIVPQCVLPQVPSHHWTSRNWTSDVFDAQPPVPLLKSTVWACPNLRLPAPPCVRYHPLKTHWVCACRRWSWLLLTVCCRHFRLIWSDQCLFRDGKCLYIIYQNMSSSSPETLTSKQAATGADCSSLDHQVLWQLIFGLLRSTLHWNRHPLSPWHTDFLYCLYLQQYFGLHLNRSFLGRHFPPVPSPVGGFIQYGKIKGLDAHSRLGVTIPTTILLTTLAGARHEGLRIRHSEKYEKNKQTLVKLTIYVSNTELFNRLFTKCGNLLDFSPPLSFEDGVGQTSWQFGQK